MNLKEHHHGSTLLLAFPQEMLQAHPGENSEHGPARPAAPSHSTAAMGTGPGAAAGRQRCHSPDVPNPASFPSFFGFAAKHSEPMPATCIEAQKNPADCSRHGFGPFATGIRIAYKRKRNGFDAKLKKKKKKPENEGRITPSTDWHCLHVCTSVLFIPSRSVPCSTWERWPAHSGQNCTTQSQTFVFFLT